MFAEVITAAIAIGIGGAAIKKYPGPVLFIFPLFLGVGLIEDLYAQGFGSTVYLKGALIAALGIAANYAEVTRRWPAWKARLAPLNWSIGLFAAWCIFRFAMAV
jgi:hypothetical protein